MDQKDTSSHVSAQVSVLDILAAVKQIEGLKGKYVKQCLTTIEKQTSTTRVNTHVRKAILDAFNDFARALEQIFSYELQD